MNTSIIFTIVSSLLGILGAIGSYYFYVKSKLNQLTIDVINIAENTDKVKHEKMELAIQELKRLLPPGASLFITDSLLQDIIQTAFDKIEEYAQKQQPKK